MKDLQNCCLAHWDTPLAKVGLTITGGVVSVAAIVASFVFLTLLPAIIITALIAASGYGIYLLISRRNHHAVAPEPPDVEMRKISPLFSQDHLSRQASPSLKIPPAVQSTLEHQKRALQQQTDTLITQAEAFKNQFRLPREQQPAEAQKQEERARINTERQRLQAAWDEHAQATMKAEGRLDEWISDPQNKKKWLFTPNASPIYSQISRLSVSIDSAFAFAELPIFEDRPLPLPTSSPPQISKELNTALERDYKELNKELKDLSNQIDSLPSSEEIDQQKPLILEKHQSLLQKLSIYIQRCMSAERGLPEETTFSPEEQQAWLTKRDNSLRATFANALQHRLESLVSEDQTTPGSLGWKRHFVTSSVHQKH